MMKKNYLVAAISITFLLLSCFLNYSCKKEVDYPDQVQMLQNAEMELGDFVKLAPMYWYGSAWPVDAELDLKWSDDMYYSPERSLKMSSSVSYDTAFAYWTQIISYAIPNNQNIKLTIMIKTEDLEGSGIAMLIRADNTRTQSVLAFETTEGKMDIKGTFDWTEFSIEMNSVPDLTNRIYVFFIYLPKTTGTAYFDNAELTYMVSK